MKKNVLRTTAIFKCIVTLKSGGHKILRVTNDYVAKITKLFRDYKKNIFKDESWLLIIGGDVLNISDIKEAKFINERTRDELLTLV